MGFELCKRNLIFVSGRKDSTIYTLLIIRLIADVEKVLMLIIENSVYESISLNLLMALEGRKVLILMFNKEYMLFRDILLYMIISWMMNEFNWLIVLELIKINTNPRLLVFT